MIKTFLRRTTVFPLMALTAPIVYYMSWVLGDSHNKARVYILTTLKEIWRGELNEN